MARKKTRVSASALAGIVTEESLKRLAGSRSFERGEDYFEDGAVASLDEYQGVVTARVQGEQRYSVRLEAKDGTLHYSCSCPFALEGNFCKHCVAAGLAWIEQARAASESKEKPLTLEDVRAFLLDLEKNELVDMLIAQAQEDDRLRERLLLRVARQRAQGAGIGALKNILSDAIEVDYFIDYGEAYDYARRVDEAIDLIEDLLKEGHAAQAVDLIEFAIDAVEDAVERADDSSGSIGGILDRLQKLYFRACQEAKLDPADLAERLLNLQLSSGYSFYAPLETYAPLLGKKGMAHYRAIVEKRWEQSQATGANEGVDYKIQGILESLLLKAGEIDKWIDIKSSNLRGAHDYLQIAEALHKAKRHDEALAWAERGRAAFPNDIHSNLHVFVADQYHRLKRHDEAMEIVWKLFAEAPRLDSYKRLAEHAKRADAWPAWREKALLFIRKKIARDRRDRPKKPYYWDPAPDHTLLVEIFLWEKDVEGAWREADEGGCRDDLMVKLAGMREKDHPEDAIAVYRAQVEGLVPQGNNQVYEQAAAFVRKIQTLMYDNGMDKEFGPYLADLRVAFKPKRNFMKLLDTIKP